MSETVIADVSKAFPNTLHQVVDAVRAYCSQNGVPLSNTTVVARPDQVSAQREFPPPSAWIFVSTPGDAVAMVTQLLQRFSGQTRDVVVLSFNPEVWRLSKQPWPGLQVRAQHPFGPSRYQPQAVPVGSLATLKIDGPEPAWTFDHVSSLEEALETLVQVLRLRRAFSAASPFRQTSLRPWMGMVNGAKFAGNAVSTRSSGMVGTLVRIAAIRGLIQVGGTDPADLLMWLKETGTLPEVKTASLEVTEPESAKIVPIAPPLVNRPEPPQDSASTITSKRRLREPDKYTCDRMSTTIDSQKMGPFPTARPVVYQALQNCVDSKGGLSFDALVEAAIQSAKGSMPGSPQPWTAIRFVTARQLLRAGVVLDEQEKPLPNAWSSGSKIVHRLAHDWMQRAEGEILLALFAAQDVTGDQLVDIARSVWGSSSAEALSRVRAVLQHLIDAGRVQEDERGVFRVKRAPAAEQTTSSTSATTNETVSRPVEASPTVDSDRLLQ